MYWYTRYSNNTCSLKKYTTIWYFASASDLKNLLSHLSIHSRSYAIASLEQFDKVRHIHKETLIGYLADSRRCGAEHNPRME